MSNLRWCDRAAKRRVPISSAFTSLRNQITQGLSLALLLVCVCSAVAAESKIATTTKLALTTNSGTATSVASGIMVTLTATVTPASGAIKAGQVNLCDASSKYCTDIHLLGTAQLTSAGMAVFKLRPGIGTHSYKAAFAGTNSEAASSSRSSTLTVTGTYPTTTTIAQAGIPNNYSLTATVTGVANLPTLPAPTGSVSFLDTSNNNADLGTAPLGSLITGLSFFNSSSPATVPEPNVVAAADFNGDGFIDLAVSNSNSGGTTLTILLGKGDGTFMATATSPTVGLYPDSVVAADFNGDGIPDLALTSVDQNLVTVLLGNGDGTFTAAPDLNTGTTPQCVATGDFNGDGIPDLAVVGGNSALIFLGNGDGSFKQTTSSSQLGGSPVKMAVGDFNNDGIADLAVTNSLQNGSVLIFLGNGDGTFTAAPTNPAAGTSAVGIATGDFDGDGNLDLAVSQYGAATTDAVAILRGNGDLYVGADIDDFRNDARCDHLLRNVWSAVDERGGRLHGPHYVVQVRHDIDPGVRFRNGIFAEQLRIRALHVGTAADCNSGHLAGCRLLLRAADRYHNGLCRGGKDLLHDQWHVPDAELKSLQWSHHRFLVRDAGGLGDRFWILLQPRGFSSIRDWRFFSLAYLHRGWNRQLRIYRQWRPRDFGGAEFPECGGQGRSRQPVSERFRQPHGS